jgi:hypothetical protein|tara:strand:+ start:265 stop:534 length:270 start_codon:yes stop_codon:yes gene_type:complete
MRPSDDLPNFWIYVKAILFFLILVGSSILLLLLDDEIHRIFYLLCVIWSSARLYYFMFYVIEHYLDEHYKFTGLWSFLRFLFRKKTDSR